MGFNDGHTSLQGAAIIANCKGCEVFSLMEPEAVATTHVLQTSFKQFSWWTLSVLCI